MEPVEDRFTKFPELALRLAYRLAAIGEKRRGLRGDYALFGQESFHPLVRFRFQSMHKGEHLAVCRRQYSLSKLFSDWTTCSIAGKPLIAFREVNNLVRARNRVRPPIVR